MRQRYLITQKPGSTQQGFVLISALIFLVILTLVITFGLSNSKLEFKMSKNAAESLRAFNNSEAARTVSVRAFQDYAFRGNWVDADGGTAGIQPATNLTVVDTTRNMAAINPAGAILTDHSTIQDPDGDGTIDPDMTYSLSGQTTNIYVMRTGSQLLPGSDPSFAGGGEGAGSGAASGGSYGLYELRADGQAADSAESMTAADLRYFLN
ncbi:MAG TPA: hypothetical protein EYP34_05945 [Chromatiaceae bacterium]|nr:hypothetical protein [Chromatiaceae bacterium]